MNQLVRLEDHRGKRHELPALVIDTDFVVIKPRTLLQELAWGALLSLGALSAALLIQAIVLTLLGA